MNTTVPIILSAPKIIDLLKKIDLISVIEEGFISLSSDKAIIPPVGELLFDNPKGETHIKYGYILQQPYFVIKIASGFYDNPKLGIKSSQGVMLAFSQQTGEIVAVLLDEGYLTDIRTVIASMITIKHLAPKKITCIGIIGTGIQAKLQLEYLRQVTNCKNIMIWGRNQEKAIALKEGFLNPEYTITVTSSLDILADTCNVIITTTPSEEPLLTWRQVKKGTHITAIGSDTPKKIELETDIIKHADLIVSDSINQSKTRGEIYNARLDNCLDEKKLIELGTLLNNNTLGRQNDQQITVADLTGVAVQDIMITSAIINTYKSQ